MRPLNTSYLNIFSTLILSLCFTFICYAGEDLNTLDADGRRQGYWKITGAMSLEAGFRKDQIVEEGHYESNKKTGVWKKYYPTGVLKNEITFENNMPLGFYKIYYPSGKLEEEGNWQRNKNVGEFKRYHENGKLAQDFTFTSAGKRDGVQNYYYDNGNLQLSVEVEEGVAHGFYKTFYPDGKPKVSKIVKKGTVDPDSVQEFEPAKEVYAKVAMPDVPEKIANADEKEKVISKFEQSGENRLYNNRKQITQAGEFKNGRLWNGKWYRYDPNGTLKKVEVYQGGKFVGYAKLEDSNN